jgi:hypothetical protein
MYLKLLEKPEQANPKSSILAQEPVAHTYNPSYLEGWNQEDQGSKAAQVNDLQNIIAKTTRGRNWLEYTSSSKEPALQT